MTCNIKNILTEAGSEPCMVDVNVLHDTLLQLPAGKYLELYNLMKNQMDRLGVCATITVSKHTDSVYSERLNRALRQSKNRGYEY